MIDVERYDVKREEKVLSSYLQDLKRKFGPDYAIAHISKKTGNDIGIVYNLMHLL
jgi:tetrahydromethanopterin S-methyltransferase subunit G